MCRRMLILVVVVLIATVSARAEIMRFESDFTDWTGTDAAATSPVSSSTGHTPGSDWTVTYSSGTLPAGWLTQGDIAGTPTTASFYNASGGGRTRFSTYFRDDWNHLLGNGLEDTGLRVDYGMNYAAGYNSKRGSFQICFPISFLDKPLNTYIRVQHTADPHTMIRPLRNGGSAWSVDTLYLKDGGGNPRYIADEWHDWTVIAAYAYEGDSHWGYWDVFLDGEHLLFGGSDGSPVLDGHTWSFRTWYDTDFGTKAPYIGLGELSTDYPWDFECDYVNFANIPEPATIALLGLGGLALLRRKK